MGVGWLTAFQIGRKRFGARRARQGIPLISLAAACRERLDTWASARLTSAETAARTLQGVRKIRGLPSDGCLQSGGCKSSPGVSSAAQNFKTKSDEWRKKKKKNTTTIPLWGRGPAGRILRGLTEAFLCRPAGPLCPFADSLHEMGHAQLASLTWRAVWTRGYTAAQANHFDSGQTLNIPGTVAGG